MVSGWAIRWFGWAVGLVVIGSGCASTGGVPRAGVQIRQILDRQVNAWNAGDIDAFMEPYRRSPDLTFSAGGELTRGWAETLKRYHQHYPTRGDMGRLRFSDLEIIDLGSRAALVLGAWHLERDEPVGGLFTLVFRKDEGKWVIVHDHTSRTEP